MSKTKHLPTAGNLKTYRRLMRYVKPYRFVLFIGILAGFLCGGSNAGLLTVLPKVLSSLDEKAETVKSKDPSLLQKINPAPKVADWLGVEKVDPEKDKISLNFLLILLGVFTFILTFKAVTMVANRYCMRRVGLYVVQDIRDLLFRHLSNQSLTFYGKSDIGTMVSRINNDTGAIERAVSTTIADLTRAPMEILGVLTYLVIFTVAKDVYFLWLLLLAVGPLGLFPIMHFSRRIKSHIRSSLDRIATLNSRMHEVFTGIRVVKAFNMEKSEDDRFQTVNRGYTRQLKKALRAELSISVVLEVVNVLLICLIFIVCFKMDMKLQELLTIAAAALLCYQPAKRLAKVNTQIQRSMAAAGRIFEILDTDTAIKDAPDAVEIAAFVKGIKLEHVDFAYDPGQPILQDVNLTIPKGDVVAFVGMAGSGKSTLVNLVGRFHDPDAGRVLIDGHDLRKVSTDSLRALIGVVTQDTILFNDTVARNICYGTKAVDEDRMIEAAKRANAHDFIMEREDGYETMVGDKGFALSGGQKQRIAIARALYKDPQILILDEATSAMDSVTEQLVQGALNELMKDRTVLAIAHRLSTIRHANCIYVLEQGKIIEQGSHEELLKLNGKYLLMNEMQALD